MKDSHSGIEISSDLFGKIDRIELVKPPTKDERESTLKINELNVKITHLKDVSLWFVSLVAVGIFVYVCLSFINNPLSSMDDKKWAASIISSISTGLIGYLTGRSAK